ncbi:MAG: RNA-binding protein [Thermoplasmata archaeon]|nr:MAG: RNA-binding protein [Thermoplasmata archaeon]RLF33887.1 MAG: RNA-binding protein [Thermoplasmata archaeon]
MAAQIKNRHRLKKREIKQILEWIKDFDNKLFLNIQKAMVETGVLDGYKIILIDGEIDFLVIEDKIFFTLHGIYRHNPEKHFVVVDMGAVGFITNGADIMAPGIVDADISIMEKDPVWICDERHRKPLAVGMALMNGEKMIKEKHGKAVKNIHHVGDRLWSLIK